MFEGATFWFTKPHGAFTWDNLIQAQWWYKGALLPVWRLVNLQCSLWLYGNEQSFLFQLWGIWLGSLLSSVLQYSWCSCCVFWTGLASIFPCAGFCRPTPAQSTFLLTQRLSLWAPSYPWGNSRVGNSRQQRLTELCTNWISLTHLLQCLFSESSLYRETGLHETLLESWKDLSWSKIFNLMSLLWYLNNLNLD